MLPRCSFVFRYLVVALFCVAVIMVLVEVNTQTSMIHIGKQLFLEPPVTNLPNHPIPTTNQIVYTHNISTVLDNHQLTPNHLFRYILNPTRFCESKNIYLLIYIHSAPVNLKKRMNIRETWGSRHFLLASNCRLVFLLGRVEKKDVMDALEMEHNHYGDLVQEDYIDSYRNLTHKGNAGLKWARHYCGSAKYVLKTDDDILVNIYRLLNHIQTKLEKNSKPAENLLLCNVWTRMGVIRNKQSKWYVSKEELPYDVFPTYCSGSAFLMSGDVVRRMEISSRTMPFFWVDDYYLTGMVFKTLQINHTPFNSAYCLNQINAESRYKNDTVGSLMYFHVNKVSIFYDLWKHMQRDYSQAKSKIS